MTTVSAQDLEKADRVVTKISELIENSILEKSDSYFRLAFRYGYVIERAFGEDTPYVLKAGFRSDSELIRTAYEENKNIELKELLNLPLELGSLKNIKSYIENNPTAATIDFIKKCNILSYPHFRPIASSSSQKQLEELFKLLADFRELVAKDVIDLSDSKYNFMTNFKRKKENRPGCFDGLCIEKNIDKIFPFAREVY
ncbi:MAG: hypothetical protein PHV52_00125 [Aliarcobacter sp.]|nr:hypothetical protein [Aliarcobacter sp.]